MMRLVDVQGERSTMPFAAQRWGQRWISGGCIVAALGICAVHIGLARLSLQQASLLAPLDSLFAIGLVLGLVSLGWAIGRRMTGAFGIAWRSELERRTFSVALGLGVLADAVLTLAFCHLLYGPVLIATSGAAALLLRSEFREIASTLQRGAAFLRRATTWRAGIAPWIAGGSLVLLLLLLLVALLPPFAYDPLWYHLAAPRIFVQQHRFVILPAIQQANFPFTVEMLYTFCLALGSDVAPAVLHLGLGALATVAVWTFSARWFDRRTGWVAVAALVTASDIHKLGVTADIDLALLLFEFLALYALLAWRDEGTRGWLVLAATMAGLAIGTKYTALPLLAPLAILLLHRPGAGWLGLRRSLAPAMFFVVCALCVASPWYVKNLVVFHNPIYPLMSSPYSDPSLSLPPLAAPSAETDSSGLAALASLPLRALQEGNGLSLTGRSLGDYLQLPLQVYLRGDLEMYGHPSLLFLFAPFALLLDRRRMVWGLAFTALTLSVVWALGPQELRYLVPVFPLFALLSADALVRVAARFQGRVTAALLVLLPVFSLLAVTLVEDVYLVRVMNPLPVLAGQQSKDAFLRRVDTNYGALAYLAGAVQPGQRVLTLGEDRSYYATVPLIIDGTRNLASRLFLESGNSATVNQLLLRAGVVYIMVNDQDMQFQAAGAPNQVGQAMAAFSQFQKQYLTTVYRGTELEVYHLNGAGPPA
jgi:4-amino-4-deoxy-L-arabinose transferase-like glycosyltransferase